MIKLDNAGFYGKLPSYSDFVKRRVTNNWVAGFDHWFRDGLKMLQENRGEDWIEDYRIAPAWRYVISGQILGPEAYMGTWCPSFDRVGRLFPLATQYVLDHDALSSVSFRQIDTHLEQIENLCFDARDTGLELDAFDTALQKTQLSAAIDISMKASRSKLLRLPFDPKTGVSDGIANLFFKQLILSRRRFSFWWTVGTVEFSPQLYYLDNFPDATEMTQFIPEVEHEITVSG